MTSSEFAQAQRADAIRAVFRGYSVERAALIHHQEVESLRAAVRDHDPEHGIAPGYRGHQVSARTRARVREAPPAVCVYTAHRSLVVGDQQGVSQATVVKRAKEAAWPAYRRRRIVRGDRRRTDCGTSGWLYWVEGGE